MDLFCHRKPSFSSKLGSVFEVHYITVISGFAGVLKSLCPVLTPKVNLTGFVFYAYISGSDHGARSGYFRPQIHFFFKIDFWAWESPPPPLIQVVVKLGGINLWKGLHFFEKHPLYRVVSYTDIGKFLSLREKIFRVATSFFVLCQKVTASRNDYSRHRRRKRPRGIFGIYKFLSVLGGPVRFFWFGVRCYAIRGEQFRKEEKDLLGMSVKRVSSRHHFSTLARYSAAACLWPQSPGWLFILEEKERWEKAD